MPQPTVGDAPLKMKDEAQKINLRKESFFRDTKKSQREKNSGAITTIVNVP